MKETRADAFNFVLKDSVQFVPEGETSRFGLSLSLLKVLRGQPWLTIADLEKLTEAEARELFETHHWESMRCDYLPAGIDYMVFDSAVVYGTAIANRWLHSALDLPPAWPIRRAVIVMAEKADRATVIGKIETYRRRFSRSHALWPVMSEVWGNRTTRVRVRACKLAKVKYEPA